MRLTPLALASLVFIALPAGAHAQAEGNDSDAVIIVRGDLRTRLSTPAAAKAFTEDTLQARGVTSLDALVIAAPGLHMINDQDPGTNIVSFRGVTTDRLQQAAIAYVIDDVALADTEFFTGALYDLDRVDVLAGPQGALFGKNAAGGAVAIRTKEAGDAGGYLSIGAGNGEARNASGAGQWSTGAWHVRVAGLWEDNQGWITNRTLNRTVDGAESRNLRLRAARAASWGDIDAKLQWMAEDGGAAWASSGDVTGDFGGKLSGAALTDPIGDFAGSAQRDWVQGAVRVRGALAGGDGLLVFARDDYSKRFVEELDYRPGALTFFGAPLFPDGLQPIAQPADIQASTLEARWSTRIGAPTHDFDMQFGVFAQDIDRDRIDDFGPLLFGADAPAYATDSLQTAIYAGLVWHNPHLTLDLQGRYDHDDRSQAITNSRTGVRTETRSANFSRFQPRVAVSFALAEKSWIYANYGEGFRTGGFNPRPGATSVWSAQFRPEVTRSFEVGIKAKTSLSANLDAALETAAFASRIEDYQSYTFLDGNSVTLSVDEVTVSGVELSARLGIKNLLGGKGEIDAAFALADGEIGAYVAPDPLLAGAVRDYRGKQVPNAPLWTATLTSAWTREITTGLHIDAGLSVNATGETFYEIDNALRSPGKVWLDGRLGVAYKSWSAAVWGKNISDERWAISAFGQGMLPLLQGLGPGGPFDTFTLNRGRQFGVELKRAF